jgi:hypothetical protein
MNIPKDASSFYSPGVLSKNSLAQGSFRAVKTVTNRIKDIKPHSISRFLAVLIRICLLVPPPPPPPQKMLM